MYEPEANSCSSGLFYKHEVKFEYIWSVPLNNYGRIYVLGLKAIYESKFYVKSKPVSNMNILISRMNTLG